MDETAWNTVDTLARWLEQSTDLPRETGTLLQILKITEEAGEVAEAVIGASGQNPRKGFSHTWDDVQNELCDVIVTAMIALTRVTPDARTVFAANLARIHDRALPQARANGSAPDGL
jgi:NTP pyrophosphatase (non-canonical NTP hydrolase)